MGKTRQRIASASLVAATLLGCGARSQTALEPDGSSPDGRLLRRPVLEACADDAPAPPTVRVVSWNIKVGLETSLARVASELSALAPDVVLIQEIEVGAARTGDVDQVQVLAEALDMPYVFGSSLPFDGGEFGLAIYSKLRFSAVERLLLNAPGTSEPRSALSATLCHGSSALRFVDIHNDLNDSANRQNVSDTLSWVRPHLGMGIALVGDFNASVGDVGPRELLAAGFVDVVAAFDGRDTVRNRRIDFVFADRTFAERVVAARVVESDASDHHALLLELAFTR